MPSCGRILAENEYILSLEEIFRGRPVVESTLFNTHSIVNDGRESTSNCTPNVSPIVSSFRNSNFH